MRTVLTGSDDVVALFTQNINPPSTYNEELFGVPLGPDSRTDVMSPDKQWFVSVQRDPGNVAMLTLSSTTADTPVAPAASARGSCPEQTALLF